MGCQEQHPLRPTPWLYGTQAYHSSPPLESMRTRTRGQVRGLWMPCQAKHPIDVVFLLEFRSVWLQTGGGEVCSQPSPQLASKHYVTLSLSNDHPLSLLFYQQAFVKEHYILSIFSYHSLPTHCILASSASLE
jgi:hypothetical protein